MNFNEYQEWAVNLGNQFEVNHTDKSLACTGLGLCEEAGEVASILKRHYRGDEKVTAKEDLKKEAGDVLNYLAWILYKYDLTLEECAIANKQKLDSRTEKGTLLGSGDNR